MKGLSLWGEGPQPRPGLNNSSQKKILNREAQDAYSYCKNYCLNHLGPLSFLTIKVIHGLLIAVKHNSQKLVGIEESFHNESSPTNSQSFANIPLHYLSPILPALFLIKQQTYHPNLLS